MARILALLLVWLLTGCEPCALVMGGHCQDRENNREEDIDSGDRDAAHCFTRPNTPVPLVPRVRGSARG